MSVICTVDSSDYWQQLCKNSQKQVVDSLSDLDNLHKDICYVKQNVSIGEIETLLHDNEDVIIVVPPPFISLRVFSDEAQCSGVQAMQTRMHELYNLFKKHRAKINFLPLSAFCLGYTNDTKAFPWIESAINTSQVATDVYSVINHSLYHQNVDLIKAYKKVQSCFSLIDNDCLFYPDIKRVNNALVQQSIDQNELVEENNKLLTQSQLLLETLEDKESELASTQKQYDEESEKLLQKSNALYEEVSLLSSKLVNIQDELAIKKQEFNSLTQNSIKEIASLREKNSSLVDELRELSSQIIDTQKELEIKKEQLSVFSQESIKESELLRENNRLMAEEVRVLSNQFITVQKELERTKEKFAVFAETSKKEFTFAEKTNKREIKRLEAKLEQRSQVEHKLRAELAGLRAMQSSKLWKASSKIEKLSYVLDKSGVKRKKLAQEMSLIYTSELFDADWYLETYPDVKREGIDPAEHYLLYGAKEGRKPSPNFDGSWYLQANPDVAEECVNPLIHYLKFGREEKRSLSPVMISHNKK
jgi:hypothetical protein